MTFSLPYSHMLSRKPNPINPEIVQYKIFAECKTDRVSLESRGLGWFSSVERQQPLNGEAGVINGFACSAKHFADTICCKTVMGNLTYNSWPSQLL